MAVANAKPASQDRARDLNPPVQVYGDAEGLIDTCEIDAIVIATSVITHYPLALRALQCGKHVLVEKPMCTRGRRMRG